MREIIGIDVGTTASKGILYDELGNELAQKSLGYPLIQDKINQAEEDPKIIFDAVQRILFDLGTIAKQNNGELVAISWSSQMHSLIGLDENFEPLTNSITWADNRAQDEVEEGKQIYTKTGIPNHPMAPIYKLKWLKKENSNLFSHVRYWVGIKEYLIARLTGQLKEDITMAAGTGLMNLENLTWDKNLLANLGLQEKQLPTLGLPTDIAGYLTDEFSEKLNISQNVPIILGASDGYLSTIGVGALNSNEFALNVGTSGAIRTLIKQPLVDEKERFFTYAAPEKKYLIGGPVNNGGIVFSWVKNTFFGPNSTISDYFNAAQTVPAGSNGLFFHPYLGGERAPIWNPDARGSFVGLTRNHTQPQMARSVLEGIIYNLAGVAKTLSDQITRPDVLKVTGGFVKSDFIRQMIADVFNVPVQTIKQEQGGGLGAFFMATLALGWEKEVKDIRKLIVEGKTYFPNPTNVKIYQSILPIYREIENDLDQTYQRIAHWQESNPNMLNK